MSNLLNFNFAGKTIAKTITKPDKNGVVRDLALIFTDGTEAQIGAAGAADAALVSVCGATECGLTGAASPECGQSPLLPNVKAQRWEGLAPKAGSAADVTSPDIRCSAWLGCIIREFRALLRSLYLLFKNFFFSHLKINSYCFIAVIICVS